MSRTLLGLFLVGAVGRPRKRKGPLRSNMEKINLAILAAEKKQSPGLKCSSESETFKPRMNISSENGSVLRGGPFLHASEPEFIFDLWVLWGKDSKLVQIFCFGVDFKQPPVGPLTEDPSTHESHPDHGRAFHD